MFPYYLELFLKGCYSRPQPRVIYNLVQGIVKPGTGDCWPNWILGTTIDHVLDVTIVENKR